MSVTWLQLRQPESFQTLAGLVLETEWFPVENHCSVLWLLVTQLYVTLCDPMDYSLPGSSIHVIFQARILEQLAIILLWGIFQPFFFFFFYSKHLLRKSVSKNLKRLSSNAVSTQNFSRLSNLYSNNPMTPHGDLGGICGIEHFISLPPCISPQLHSPSLLQEICLWSTSTICQ